ncbi:MAG: DUF3795 domain-containing protein [Firmicutes bacterium]|nr:DUF3795 domain-containing protein [Bacillota bacterium]
MADEKNQPNLKLAAVCGLFCPSCGLYQATIEGDQEKLKGIAERFGRTIDEVTCEGCRTDNRSFFCNNLCTMFKCAGERGIRFCGECADYPCGPLKEFQSLAPHRLELWNAHARIKEAGYEQWYREMAEFYSCRECGAMNSAYDLKCRICGASPGNAFVERHQQSIVPPIIK